MAKSNQADGPVYQVIQRTLQQRILREKLRPGNLLPSERELARLHGVSLMTARKALTGLEQEGVVERRPGAGTFVAIPQVRYNQLLSTTELMAARGSRVESRTYALRIVYKHPEVCTRLRLDPEDPLIKMERLRLADGQPLAFETAYLSAERYAALAKQPLEDGSLFRTLEERYAVKISHADEEVDAVAASAKAARYLKIEPGTPVLRIEQLIHSSKGEPVVYVLGLYRSDRHKLVSRRSRQ